MASWLMDWTRSRGLNSRFVRHSRAGVIDICNVSKDVIRQNQIEMPQILCHIQPPIRIDDRALSDILRGVYPNHVHTQTLQRLQ